MFHAQSLLSLLVLAVSFGSSIAIPAPLDLRSTLAFSRSLNFTGYANIADADRARARVLKAQGLAPSAVDRRASISATNTAVTYTVVVGVSSPATTYTLLIDTGSSNTWIGAAKPYVKTSTSVNTGNQVSVSYGSGEFSGTECIGVASSSSGFSGVDGILGIGPVALTAGTVSGVSSVPTITDNLYSKGIISTEEIGIFYAPTSSQSVTNGELTIGGVDSSKYTGSITYTSLTTTSPASLYWGINQSVTYGSTSILSSTAGIVDTGTTLILLATNAYNLYVKATNGLLEITSAQYSALSALNFNIGGTSYSLSANAQIWPRALNTYIGGASSSMYLIVNNLGSNSGEGLDFINGYTFLERYYSVFDTTNKRIGFATTVYTTATSN